MNFSRLKFLATLGFTFLFLDAAVANPEFVKNKPEVVRSLTESKEFDLKFIRCLEMTSAETYAKEKCAEVKTAAIAKLKSRLSSYDVGILCVKTSNSPDEMRRCNQLQNAQAQKRAAAQIPKAPIKK